MSKIVKFMCTAFRDGFQSAYGARVLTEDFIPAVKAARDAGITYFEAGGGARFQSLYFYCNQDAFTMMDIFRKTVGPDANLQTLARGVNVVGLESQSSEIIRLHAKLFKKHRPFAKKEAKIMLIEPQGVVNTGNIESELTASNDQWI